MDEKISEAAKRKHLSPLERQKDSYKPMRSLDEMVGLVREKRGLKITKE